MLFSGALFNTTIPTSVSRPPGPAPHGVHAKGVFRIPVCFEEFMMSATSPKWNKQQRLLLYIAKTLFVVGLEQTVKSSTASG